MRRKLTLTITLFMFRGAKIQKEIFPAATDSRFIRNVGIPALGMTNRSTGKLAPTQ